MTYIFCPIRLTLVCGGEIFVTFTRILTTASMDFSFNALRKPKQMINGTGIVQVYYEIGGFITKSREGVG